MNGCYYEVWLETDTERECMALFRNRGDALCYMKSVTTSTTNIWALEYRSREVMRDGMLCVERP